MKMGRILNENSKISTKRAPKIRRVRTSWKKGTKNISSPKRVLFQEVSFVHMDVDFHVKILRPAPNGPVKANNGPST